eukprot:4804307-Amphidinium_carterae.1
MEKQKLSNDRFNCKFLYFLWFFVPHAKKGALWNCGFRNSQDEEGGVEMVFARSVPDSGCTWASIFPWAVEYGAWEKATTPTIGFVEVDTAFWPDPNMKVSLISPPVFVDVGDDYDVPDPPEPPNPQTN